MFIDDTAKVNSDTGENGILARKKAEAEARVRAVVDDNDRAKAEVKARARAEVMARTDVEAITMARVDAEATAMARAKADAEADAEAEAITGVTAKVRAETRARITIAKAIAKARAEVKAEAEAEADAEADARIAVCGEAYNEAEAKARDEAGPTLTTVAKFQALATLLHHLATDCLRLSMHFFHPIQKCAQQVYHTAIPLSPTSSHLQKYCLQSVLDNQLSLVTTFSGAPDTWGLLLRTIDIRPRQLTSIATSVHGIIAACGDLVNIYDPVTFVLQQSLSIPEPATKIQDSPDGSVLFFTHSFSISVWDVQTGGLIHTFTVQSKISDIAVSTTGDHIACGSSDGSITTWDIHTKKGNGKRLGYGQPVITICWVSPLELVVATQRSLYVHNIISNEVLHTLYMHGKVWGMVCLVNKVTDEGEILVGMSWLGAGASWCSFEISKYKGGLLSSLRSQPLTHHGQLSQPVLAGEEIVCITQPTGVQSFNTKSYNSTNPPLLDAAASMAVSLNRNIVARTKDSIQVFSLDVLKSGKIRDVVRLSHVYPLDENHIICIVQPTRNLALLELETLRELRPEDDTSPLRSLPLYQSPSVRSPFGRGPAAEFGVSVVIEAWESGTPLPEWTESTNEDGLLCGLSPERTHIVTIYGSPRRGLRVKDAKDGTILANLPLDDDLATGEVYALTFDSETRFHLKIDGPGQHIQIHYDITASPSGSYSHTITKGEPAPLPEPRKTSPYSLDANFEWVLDTESRKVCWIPPRNIRRVSGGHFWVGLSLVMVGDDGVVRKLSFKEPGR